MFLLRAVLNILVRNASPRRPCVLDALYLICQDLVNFYFYFVYSLFFVYCVLDSVCELFGETIRNVFGCSCYFVVKCYGCV